jgi:hypothetical protein
MIAVAAYVLTSDDGPAPAQRSASAPPAAAPAARPAQAARAAPPAAFELSANPGGTPGDDYARHAAISTPQAAFDAYRLVEACQRQRQYDPDKTNPELRDACVGITPQMEREAGQLIAYAMAHNVEGAAVEFWRAINRVPVEQLSEVAESPSMREGVQTMIAALKVAAQYEREAIAALSLLYGRTTPIQQRDPAQALTYVTALRALSKGPALAASDAYVERLVAELTPEQVQQARSAGLELARQCNCRG